MLIKNTKARVFVSKSGHRYIPGMNLVSDDEGNSPEVQAWIKSGAFVQVAQKTETMPDPEPAKEEAPAAAQPQLTVEEAEEQKVLEEASALSNLDVDEAVQVMKEHGNIKVLRAVIEVSNMAEVKEAAQARITELTDHRGEEDAKIETDDSETPEAETME